MTHGPMACGPALRLYAANDPPAQVGQHRRVTLSATRFDVSPTAMHWRLFSFGLIVERPLAQDAGTEASPVRRTL